MSGESGPAAEATMTNPVKGHDRAARAAVDRAKDEDEPMMVTADH